MSVCWDCCVLSGRGLYDELITRPEESYRLWYVVVCDLETTKILVNKEEAKAHQGAVAPRKKNGLLTSALTKPCKEIPVEVWTDPEGSKSLRLPDFKTTDT